MGLYIFCPRKSDGALALCEALEAKRLRRFDGMDFWGKNKRLRLEEGSTVVCWGTALPELDNLQILNSLEKKLNKYEEAVNMAHKGVNTIKTALADAYHSKEDYRKAGYIPRTYEHTGGADILDKDTTPDFYVLKEKLTHEIRIHTFAGRSIRAGTKILREGFEMGTEGTFRLGGKLAHPWIRSFDGGWRISYDGFKSTKDQRELAKKATTALGLTFGAVDIGIKADKSLIVLEVNTAPGLEGGTLAAYTRAIQSWIDKDKEDEGEEE